MENGKCVGTGVEGREDEEDPSRNHPLIIDRSLPLPTILLFFMCIIPMVTRSKQFVAYPVVDAIDGARCGRRPLYVGNSQPNPFIRARTWPILLILH